MFVSIDPSKVRGEKCLSVCSFMNPIDQPETSTDMAMAMSYNWLFQWDYTFYKWGFLSTYNW